MKKLFKALFMKVLAARTVANDPLQKFMFRVSIPGLPTGVGFQKVGGLSKEMAVIEYMEGLFVHAHKLAGREKVGEVVLERGMYASRELEELYEKVLKNPSSRFTMVVQLMDRFGSAKRTWKLAEAWVSKYESTDFDATSDDVAIEKITVQFEFFLD